MPSPFSSLRQWYGRYPENQRSKTHGEPTVRLREGQPRELGQQLSRPAPKNVVRVPAERGLARVHLDHECAVLERLEGQRGCRVDQARGPDREEHVAPRG